MNRILLGTGVILFSLILKILLFIMGLKAEQSGFSPFYSPDSQSYLTASLSLEKNHSFYASSSPEIFRTPGYPLFLYLIKQIHHSSHTIILIQILISLLSLYLLFCIVSKFISEKAAFISSVLYCLDPLSNLYTLKIMPETLFTFFILFFLQTILLAGKTNQYRHYLLAGILAAMASYIRPLAQFLILIPCFQSIFLIMKKHPVRPRLWINYLIMIGSFYVCIFPWQWRNYKKADYFGMSTVTAVNLYFYRAAAVLAEVKGIDYYSMRKEMGAYDSSIVIEKNPELKNASSGKIASFIEKEGKNIIFGHLKTYLKIHWQGIIRILLDPGSAEFLKYFGLYKEGSGLLGQCISHGVLTALTDLFKTNPILFWLTLFSSPWNFFLAAFTIWFLIKKEFPFEIRVMVLLFILYFLILSGGPEATGRFRIPILPVMTMAAGAFLDIMGAKKIKNSAENAPWNRQ
ncbi:MAG: glycosyltransferase family 39 protein [Candidatus Aureabacteria bacterium]|nr:glycosyltransferase family 39 protein [Candidatus Auribacterota bacterium]